MDNNSFSQESVESVAMEAGTFADGQDQLQLDGGDNNIVIVMQGNNSSANLQNANTATVAHTQGQVKVLLCGIGCLFVDYLSS